MSEFRRSEFRDASKTDLPASPPAAALRRRMLLLPAALAIVGMLIAWATVTAGQDVRRTIELLRVDRDIAHLEAQLASARLNQKEPATIQALQEHIHLLQSTPLIPYARYGRQFTQWDGYRYEEIADQGYLFHMPEDSEAVKAAARMKAPGAGAEEETRWKNVVWYPLYPLLAWVVAHGLRIPATIALTGVSWTCCLLGAMVTYAYVRRFFAGRASLLTANAAAGRQPMEPDAAAGWTVILLLFGPCSIFLYSNFTESLFLLLLSSFLYCVHARWWWRAALIAAVASACRSQGVLFGPVLAVIFLVRAGVPLRLSNIARAALLGFISALGLLAYMIFLQYRFHDALAFMHGQRYWNVGIDLERIRMALNPIHAWSRFFALGFMSGPMDWPRTWEAACVVWPPILLLVLGWRYLSLELVLIGWMMWGLPYVSNSMAGSPPGHTPWMSMGRFMAVTIPLYVIMGGILARRRWMGLGFLVIWAASFGVFAYIYGLGEWVG